MTSSTGPGIGRSASPAIHRRGFGIRLSRARSFIARIVLVANARARRTPPSLGGCGSRSREGAGERGKNRQVSVKRDAIQSANAERQQRPLILEPSELALDCGAARVQLSPSGSLARNQGMQPIGRHPSARGAALARRTAPLGSLAPVIGPGEPPLAMLATRGPVVAALDGLGLTELF
jgi:hypothetical protein